VEWSRRRSKRDLLIWDDTQINYFIAHTR
jgi:hypothetical protein